MMIQQAFRQGIALAGTLLWGHMALMSMEIGGRSETFAAGAAAFAALVFASIAAAYFATQFVAGVAEVVTRGATVAITMDASGFRAPELSAEEWAAMHAPKLRHGADADAGAGGAG